MKTTLQNKTRLALAAAIAGLALAAAPANAQISIVSQAKGFVDSTKTKIATTHLGTTLLSYDATGVRKLVIAIGTESGFNGNGVDVTGLTFNDVAFTQAVAENTRLGDGGCAEIWYLDNPFQGSATFGLTFTTTGGSLNGGFVSVIGLSGTADGAAGIGATAAAWTNVGPVTCAITTTANGSLVITMVENSGTPNAAGTPTVNAPLTQIYNGSWGSQWGSAASGYQFVPALGTTVTPTFTTTTGAGYSIHTVAVEIKPPIPTQYWDVNDIAPGAGGPAATGTWDAAATNWNPKADGTDPCAAWSSGATAVFAAGTDATDAYTVTVDGTNDITGLTFEEGTVTLANGTSGVLRLTGNTPANVASGRTATIATQVTEDAAGRELVKVGSGTLVLSGDSSYTGAGTVALGTLVLSGNNSAATGGMAINGGLTRFESPASINGTARNVTNNAGGTVVFGSSFGTIQSSLTGRIVNTSAGVIAADDHGGESLDFSSAGADFTLAYLGAVGNVSYTGTLTPNGTNYRLGGGGGTLTMANANAVTGAGNSLVVKGNVALSAANNYDGGTTLNAGVLAVGNDGALGSSTLTINGGAIQSADGTAHVLANALALGANVTVGGTGGMTFADSSATALGATRTFTIANSSSTFAQAFSGTGFGITKAGAGVLTLSGANTYDGTTTVNAGTLLLSGGNSSAGATTLTAGTLQLGGSSNGGLASGTLTFGNATAGAAVIQAVTSDRIISNQLTLNQNNGTFSGSQSLQVNGIFLNSGGNRTLTSSLESGRTLTLAGQVKLSEHATTGRTLTITGTGETRVSGQVVNGATGAGGLTKSGTGLLILANTNNLYTGATMVNAGTLLVNGTTAAESAVTVATNATLGGSGTINGPVTVNAGGHLAPGASAGTLSIGGSLDLSAQAAGGTGRLNFELDALAGLSDKIAVTGTLTIGSGLLGFNDFVFTNLGGLQAGTYKLITSGGISGTLDGADLSSAIGAFTGTLQITGNDLELVVTGGGPLTPLAFSGVGPLSGSSFSLTFNGPSGQNYQVLTTTNIALPMTNWTLLTTGTFSGSPVIYTNTNATNAQQFYRLVLTPVIPPTPPLSENFESGATGWTTGSDGDTGTAWELGVPENVGPAAAHSPGNCFGTNIRGLYGVNANVWLRSPVIDLTTAPSATLRFWQFKNIEPGMDSGSVRLLDASDNSELVVVVAVVDGTTANWEQVSCALPPAALGRPIKLEFRFRSDGDLTFAGWYIDDVAVTVP